MREKEKWAREYTAEAIKKFNPADGATTQSVADLLSSTFILGFNLCKEKAMDLCDAHHQVVSFTELNRLGEKQIK